MIRARSFISFFLLLFATVSLAAAKDPDAEARALFELFFEESVSLSPMWQTELGRKTNYDKWDDISPERSEVYHQLSKEQLARLTKLDTDILSPANKLNSELQRVEMAKASYGYQWRE